MTDPAASVPDMDDLKAFRKLVTEGLSARRFTQTSPVLPDVWLAYAAAPDMPQELLVTPHRRSRAGRLAHSLRTEIDAWRGEARADRPTPRVASVPDLVAVRLHLDELIAVLLPWTDWWARIIQHPNGISNTDGRRMPRGSLGPAERARIAVELDEARESRRAEGGLMPLEKEWNHEFLALVAVSGWIQCGVSGQEPPASRTLVDAFAMLFPDGLTSPAKTGHDTPWRVALNRSMTPAGDDSILAVKADAAVRLFDITCKRVTWAILDGGIDGSHPAFYDWSATNCADAPRPSRVDQTYDFSELRDLLDPRTMTALAEAEDADLSEAEARLKRRLRVNLEALGYDEEGADGRYTLDMRRRIEAGLEIDWALLDPFLHDPAPSAPLSSHGTHVAGVLGGGWYEDAAAADGGLVKGASVMEGMCPDIRLYDMRVLRQDAPMNEFEVISALQFIAFLNRRADTQVVQGANLSIQTLHKIDNYACGSTPVCEQCDRVWASGVVLVAAAGNRGHQNYVMEGGESLGGYHAISITDPGNAQGVITVGATHVRAHRYGVSYFSSRGPTGDGRQKPDLVAPGEGIRGPVPNGAESTANGTSFAAPHVSGAAALLMARLEELRGQPDRIKAILCDTATDLRREKYFQGAGMVDVLRALQSM
ncbi:MAG: S8 family serine peptidase [Jannaschia sp.]